MKWEKGCQFLCVGGVDRKVMEKIKNKKNEEENGVMCSK